MKAELAKQIAEKTRADYDALSTVMDLTRREVWDELKDLVPDFKSGDRVLDAGSGNGRMVQALTGAIPGRRLSVRNYVGVDSSPELVKRAQIRYPQATFMIQDVTDLKFPDASFDHIFSIAVLHQIPGASMRDQALDEAYRVLKPGGTLLLSVWNLWQPKYLKYLLKSSLLGIFGGQGMDFGDVLIPWKGKGISRYYHAFCFGTVRRLLLSHGFEIITLRRGRNFVFLARKKMVG